MELIAKALVKAQLEMSTPAKNSSNPFFKNKYADLNEVLNAVVPALNNNGVVLLQPIVSNDGKNFIRTVLMHESGQFFDSFTEIFCSKPNDAQSFGSGVSYARRYALSSICGVGSEDDDGNKSKAQAIQQQIVKLSDVAVEKIKTKQDAEKYLQLLKDGKVSMTQVQELKLKNILKDE